MQEGREIDIVKDLKELRNLGMQFLGIEFGVEVEIVVCILSYVKG